MVIRILNTSVNRWELTLKNPKTHKRISHLIFSDFHKFILKNKIRWISDFKIDETCIEANYDEKIMHIVFYDYSNPMNNSFMICADALREYFGKIPKKLYFKS